MKKTLLSIFLCSISASAIADYLHIHYKGTVTKGSSHANILPFGYSKDRPEGYKLGSTVSGTITVDIDVANSFEPVSTGFGIWASYYNQPAPNHDNQQIIYKNYWGHLVNDAHSEVAAQVNASQAFIVGGFHTEPSSLNDDYIKVRNGSDITSLSDPNLMKDLITVVNSDYESDHLAPFNRPSYRYNTYITIKSQTVDFLDNLSLAQTFSLSGDDLDGLGSYQVQNSIDTGSRAHIKHLPQRGLIEFKLDSVVAEVSPYPHADCQVCD